MRHLVEKYPGVYDENINKGKKIAWNSKSKFWNGVLSVAESLVIVCS